MSESALTTRDAMPVASLEDVEKIGTWMAESGMFGCKNKAQAVVLALTCQMEKITPIEFGRKYHLIDGKPAMRTDSMLASFHKLGGSEKWTRTDNDIAEATWTYRDNKDIKLRFAIDDAKRAGVIRPGSGWTKYPDAMLRARLIAKAVRMLCPEAITGGGYSAEEMEDMRVTSMPASSGAAMTEAPKTLAPEDVAVSPPPGAEDAPPAPDTKPDPSPEVAPDDFAMGPIDTTIIPFGKMKGKRFDEQSQRYLAAFVAKAAGQPGVTQAHISYADAILSGKQRKGEGAA